MLTVPASKYCHCRKDKPTILAACVCDSDPRAAMICEGVTPDVRFLLAIDLFLFRQVAVLISFDFEQSNNVLVIAGCLSVRIGTNAIG